MGRTARGRKTVGNAHRIDRRALRRGIVPPSLVLLLLVSGVGSLPSAAAAPAGAAPTAGVAPSASLPLTVTPSASPVATRLALGGIVGYLSPEFWGTTINNEVHMLRGETNAVNATTARVLVWPGAMAGEDYDPLTNTHYDTYTGSPKTALTSEAQFVAMCKATHCTAIVQLPAEIDNPRYAESIVNYTEVNLSFTPAYWMIGNEPELWSHWQVPWSKWGYDYTGGPTPTQFGNEVLAYLADLREVDPTTPILGLPASGCTCGSWTFAQWISAVLNVTGDKIQAVAFHEYPAGWLGTGDGSLFDFYATINGAASIPVRMVSARAAVQSSCPKCNVSVFISELGAALSWSAYGGYADAFSGALSIGAQITQAMTDNLTNVDLFAAELATTNSWFSPQGGVRPDYAEYTQIFPHLGTTLYPVNFTGSAGSLYGIATVDPNDHNREDLYVVNANITKTVAFTPQFPTSTGGAPVQALYWNGSIHTGSSNHTTWVEPYTPDPIAQFDAGGLPANFTLPPQTMVLFESYPGGATYVNVRATNVPTGTPWYTSLGSRYVASTQTNFSRLLPSGAYPISASTINLPIGGTELNPVERLAGFVPSPLPVSGTYTNTTVSFVTQWEINVTASPSYGGTVGPTPTWWNQSAPLTLNVQPAFGYAFTRWGGWGPGSYNGTGRTVTIVPTGRVDETAHFALGQPALFWEDGLPAGTSWSVLVRQFTTSSVNSTLTVYEPFGTYGYHVNSVPGYRILPQNGSFSVYGWATHIQFVRLTPPPPTYTVTFVTTGLPAGTSVAITVRDVVTIAGPNDPSYQLINGSYAYHVGYVAGYHANVPLKLFVVHGKDLIVQVPFVVTNYTITWEAQGVRTGLAWTVTVAGTTYTPTSAWLSVAVPNGTYAYTVSVPQNFTTSPRDGTIAIGGTGTQVFLIFDLDRWSLGFEATGAGAMSGWSVRFGNQTVGATANRTGFFAPNGTYTFDVHAPPGYYAVPSHGSITVAGPVEVTQVHFYPTSLRPSAALVAQLTSGAIGVALWIGLSVLLSFAVLRTVRRRRRGG